jgi:hypothetical protein
MALGMSAPTRADDALVAAVEPAQISLRLEAERMQPGLVLRGSHTAPALTNDLLASYVERQQALRNFDGFDVQPATALTEQVLLGYIDRTRSTSSLALDAIDSATDEPALNGDMLEIYAQKKFVPTVKKVKFSNEEMLCLTKAIYHEARGESEDGQWAVANVIINRALSKKFPSTLCGVVYQNADQGLYRCQFSFACDGKPDMAKERGAWHRAEHMALTAFRDYQQGSRPGVVPNSALYYHTSSVSPDWSNKFRRVATIGAHEFYAAN